MNFVEQILLSIRNETVSSSSDNCDSNAGMSTLKGLKSWIARNVQLEQKMHG